jgi:hypothetical protein
MNKTLTSILHWKHRNVIHPFDGTRNRRSSYELFGYYECLKCSRGKKYLVLHRMYKIKRGSKMKVYHLIIAGIIGQVGLIVLVILGIRYLISVL